jgi:catechol 2,3-dioxygenase-like lactoylglutathione lyase family enzyme
MKRLHVHVSVPDLAEGIRFYQRMFGAEPTRIKEDYAKWQLEDPRVNFAISTRSAKIGLDHLGIQLDDEQELAQLKTQLDDGDIDSGTLDATTCCYAQSVKSWSFDPAGIPWESFVTMNEVDVFGVDSVGDSDRGSESACCSGFPGEVEVSSCC